MVLGVVFSILVHFRFELYCNGVMGTNSTSEDEKGLKNE